MRVLFLSLTIFSLFLTACASTSSLPTDTDEIDISGRWNATDSEIAASELINKLTKSSWYGTLKNEAGSFINFEVKPVAGGDSQSLVNSLESIQEAIHKHIALQQNLRSIKEEQSALPIDYYIAPTISQTETKSKKETVYLYTLKINVFDNKEELVYEAQETVKKYIKN